MPPPVGPPHRLKAPPCGCRCKQTTSSLRVFVLRLGLLGFAMRLLESWRVLARLKASLKLVIPVALAADTARSIVFTYRLAQARLLVGGVVAVRQRSLCVLQRRGSGPILRLVSQQTGRRNAAPLVAAFTAACRPALVRMQEWEQEDAEDTKQEVRRLLRTVLRRCAAQDPDFWPKGLAAAASKDGEADPTGDLAPTPAVAAGGAEQDGDASTGDVWRMLGLATVPATAAMGAEPVTAVAASAGPAAAAAGQLAAQAAEQQLVTHEQEQRTAAEAAAAARQAAQGATLVMVTLREAMAQVAASLSRLQLPYSTLMAQQSPAPGVVMHVTLADVASILAASRPARAAAAAGTSVGQGVLSAADALHAGLLRSVPWPQLQLSRKSALRCVACMLCSWRAILSPLRGALECC